MKNLASFLLIITALLVLAPKDVFSLNSPENVATSTGDLLAPTITADSNGKIHLVWMDAPSGWSSPTTSLKHSIWNGSTWSVATTVASGNFHELPSLAADTSGNVHLTWDADTNPSAWQIYYSKWNGTSWSAAVAISGATAGDVAWDSEIAIDSSGNPHVAYTFVPSSEPANRYTYHTRWTGTAWTTPVNLSDVGTFNQYPAIDADSASKVHIGWKKAGVGGGSFEIVHRFWNGTTFSATASISGIVAGGQEPQPRITVSPNDNAHVVWEQQNPSGDFDVKYSKYDGASWSAPFLVTNIAQQSNQGIPSVGIGADSTNNIYVGWIDKSTSPFDVGFRKFNNSTSAWEAAQTSNTSLTSADFPAVTVDKWDNFHIAWGEVNSITSKYELFYDAVPVAVKVIGSAGGSLTTSNGDTMTISSGSLSTNTTISMQIAPLANTAPSGFSALPRQYIFEPAGTTFNPPIEIVFKYSDAEFSGAAEKNLGVYVWDSVLAQWVFKTGTINKAQNTVTITLDHFSIFSIFSAPDTLTWYRPAEAEFSNDYKLGRTVPVKFKFDEPVDNPAQVKVQIVDSLANVVKEFVAGVGAENLRYNPDDEKYIANFDTKPQNLGDYQIKIIYQNLLKASLEFSLVE